MANRINIGPPGSILDWDNWGSVVTNLLNEYDTSIANLTSPSTRVSTDQPRVATTTMTDVTGLQLTVVPNVTYRAQLFLIYDGSTAGDLKYQLVGPSGTTFPSWYTYGLDVGDTGPLGTLYRANVVFPAVHGCLTTSPPSALINAGGLISVGTTGGIISVQAAQNTASGTTTIRAGSFLVLTRV